MWYNTIDDYAFSSKEAIGMDDFLEQTASPVKKGASAFLYYGAWALMVVCGMVAIFAVTGVLGTDYETGRMIFRLPSLLVALAFGGLTFLLFRVKDECRVEYDYAFTNGNLDVSKVMNERRRRYLCAMDTKDVISCGPAQGPAFQKALNEPGVKTHNWFVNREAKLTFFYFQKKGAKHVIVLELNDEMLSVIRSKKYLQVGVWHDADGKSTYASIS